MIGVRERMKEAFQKFSTTDLEGDNQLLKEAKEMLYATYTRLNEEDLREKVDRIQSVHGAGKYGEAWRVINEVTGRKTSQEGQVAGASPEERVTTWFTHFQKLLGASPNVEDADEGIQTVFEDLGIEDGTFTKEEYDRAKSSLKQGKSPGPDNIPPEVFKNCDQDDIVIRICNMALMKNSKPEQWLLSNIIPVPKKGNLSNTDNYRGISLTCIIAKLYNRMILNRIRGAIDPELRVNQNGFRPRRTTVAQILAIRRIIEEVN